ncbi:MAG TPA: hypothetical protein VG319_15200, partial [Polyangia bacterium]|nr:hypothetical protein [Polyangia bacterium]
MRQACHDPGDDAALAQPESRERAWRAHVAAERAANHPLRERGIDHEPSRLPPARDAEHDVARGVDPRGAERFHALDRECHRPELAKRSLDPTRQRREQTRRPRQRRGVARAHARQLVWSYRN